MNPDTIGCVWTGEFDLNTLRVDGEIFESGKKKLPIQKYPDLCGRGLSQFYKIVKNLAPCRRSRENFTLSIRYHWLECSGPRCSKLCISSHF